MQLYPAIDMKDGKCVRLLAGAGGFFFTFG